MNPIWGAYFSKGLVQPPTALRILTPQKVAILRTRTPAIQVQTLPLECPRILKVDLFQGVNSLLVQPGKVWCFHRLQSPRSSAKLSEAKRVALDTEEATIANQIPWIAKGESASVSCPQTEVGVSFVCFYIDIFCKTGKLFKHSNKTTSFLGEIEHVDGRFDVGPRNHITLQVRTHQLYICGRRVLFSISVWCQNPSPEKKAGIITM